MKKILGVGLVLLVAVSSFLLPLWLTPADAPAPGLPIVATSHFLPKQAAASATTQPIRTEYAGRVWEVYFHEGQRVRKGQVLLKLIEKLPSVAQQQLQARLRQQQHAYDALVAGASTSDSALAAAREQLASTRDQLARAVPLLSYVFVTAPADGIVSGQLVRIGDYLAAQTPVAQLSSALLTADTTLLLSSVE
ncbi:efflux RND transporter periplasmic adaptor subunit [Hymenobacter sp. HSC-4F20]|uniref:efflux RND transporter periplasmic adaptor subunit n=1 Tax=Hymenobacter sp. HSC-4F20 TaxID=2864135 RepID=UPI001C7399EB|nr:biotin/lipoyl-binding protein [Hymenobacter sp. HSC-4F20]MBX0291735.1 efflux RND transporter periplasmic adaptor subunit [Hymenobacter sp. HSC-4F20]